MLSNKTQTEKSETFLLAHALLLLVLSLLVGVQGIFEIIDYMPHIISAGCVNCGAYVASIPSTLIYNVSVVFCFCSGLLLQGKQKNVRPYPLYVYYRHSAEPCV